MRNRASKENCLERSAKYEVVNKLTPPCEQWQIFTTRNRAADGTFARSSHECQARPSARSIP